MHGLNRGFRRAGDVNPLMIRQRCIRGLTSPARLNTGEFGFCRDLTAAFPAAIQARRAGTSTAGVRKPPETKLGNALKTRRVDTSMRLSCVDLSGLSCSKRRKPGPSPPAEDVSARPGLNRSASFLSGSHSRNSPPRFPTIHVPRSTQNSPREVYLPKRR